VTSPIPSHVSHYSREDSLASLDVTDSAFPPSETSAALRDPANGHLLGYTFAEAFTHVFPGDRTGYGTASFFADLDAELRASPAFHLWAEVPLCRYRCHFCQFPILVLSGDENRAAAAARRWVDSNIAEAKLWLDAVPSMRHVPVGELCLFGGTPTAVPSGELERLVDFYVNAFTVDDDTSLRLEGSPDSLTAENLAALRRLGFATLTFGIQSFDDELLQLANRRHTGDQAIHAIKVARQAGYERVDGDLVWGLPGQSVGGFLADVSRMIELAFSTIVVIKLHLRPFGEVDSAIGHVRPTPWENPAVRANVAARGHRWPSLGEQFQMREGGVDRLRAAGYYEHPTTYFPHRSVGPERWRSMNLDQAKQHPQVGIGLGAYTWSARSEASVTSDPQAYAARVGVGEIPFDTVTQISDEGREARAVRMALSTCQPLTEQAHRARFPHSSLFGDRWSAQFGSMARRGLAIVDRAEETVALTDVGMTLVEAIINTEVR
jgi:oxygen-independent coproporphyrinogen III oxidase